MNQNYLLESWHLLTGTCNKFHFDWHIPEVENTKLSQAGI